MLCLKVVTFDYGMKTEDPIEKVLFYEKNSPNKAEKNSKVLEILLMLSCFSQSSIVQKSPMLPKAFTEHHIRVYVKDENNFPDAKRWVKLNVIGRWRFDWPVLCHLPVHHRCFDKWWKMQMEQLPITEEPGMFVYMVPPLHLTLCRNIATKWHILGNRMISITDSYYTTKPH